MRATSASSSSLQMSLAKPWRVSSSCSVDVAPTIVDVTNGRESQKAIASAAGEIPAANAAFE